LGERKPEAHKQDRQTWAKVTYVWGRRTL